MDSEGDVWAEGREEPRHDGHVPTEAQSTARSHPWNAHLAEIVDATKMTVMKRAGTGKIEVASEQEGTVGKSVLDGVMLCLAGFDDGEEDTLVGRTEQQNWKMEMGWRGSEITYGVAHGEGSSGLKSGLGWEAAKGARVLCLRVVEEREKAQEKVQTYLARSIFQRSYSMVGDPDIVVESGLSSDGLEPVLR